MFQQKFIGLFCCETALSSGLSSLSVIPALLAVKSELREKGENIHDQESDDMKSDDEGSQSDMKTSRGRTRYVAHALTVW